MLFIRMSPGLPRALVVGALLHPEGARVRRPWVHHWRALSGVVAFRSTVVERGDPTTKLDRGWRARGQCDTCPTDPLGGNGSIHIDTGGGAAPGVDCRAMKAAN